MNVEEAKKRLEDSKSYAESYEFKPEAILEEINKCLSDSKFKAFKDYLILLTTYLVISLITIKLGGRMYRAAFIAGIILVTLIHWLSPSTRLDWTYFKKLRCTLLDTLCLFEAMRANKDSDWTATHLAIIMVQEKLMSDLKLLSIGTKVIVDHDIHKQLIDLYKYISCECFIIGMEEDIDKVDESTTDGSKCLKDEYSMLAKEFGIGEREEKEDE